MKNALNKIDKEREGWKKAIDTENLELYLKTVNNPPPKSTKYIVITHRRIP